MKKNLALLLFLGLTLQIFGQLNPVNNLYWHQWYNTPNNYFELSWHTPDQSSDTLIGYNIYRENELYKFQADTNLYHLPNGSNCGLDFLEFVGYIHVTAVYNSSFTESDYIDSAYCIGLLIGEKELIQPKLTLFPNPTTGKVNIDNKNINKIFVINQKGEILKEYISEAQIDISNFAKGIYFIKVITEQGIFVEKIVLK